jgi:hypothetical protein
MFLEIRVIRNHSDWSLCCQTVACFAPQDVALDLHGCAKRMLDFSHVRNAKGGFGWGAGDGIVR